ncbi:MAG: hypothetical protein ACYDH0_01780 [Candidatus Aminicenantales bacterium]
MISHRADFPGRRPVFGVFAGVREFGMKTAFIKVMLFYELNIPGGPDPKITGAKRVFSLDKTVWIYLIIN